MLTKKTKIILGVSVSAFLLSVSGVYITWNVIQKKGKELTRKTTALVNFEAQNKRYRELEKLIADTKPERTQLQKYVLTEDDTIDFLSTIEQLAKNQSVELSTDALKVQDNEGQFDTLLISYRIEGMKTRVDTFLELLESLPYQAIISNIYLQYDKKEGVDLTTATFTLAITLVNYDT